MTDPETRSTTGGVEDQPRGRCGGVGALGNIALQRGGGGGSGDLPEKFFDKKDANIVFWDILADCVFIWCHPYCPNFI